MTLDYSEVAYAINGTFLLVKNRLCRAPCFSHLIFEWTCLSFPYVQFSTAPFVASHRDGSRRVTLLASTLRDAASAFRSSGRRDYSVAAVISARYLANIEKQNEEQKLTISCRKILCPLLSVFHIRCNFRSRSSRDGSAGGSRLIQSPTYLASAIVTPTQQTGW